MATIQEKRKAEREWQDFVKQMREETRLDKEMSTGEIMQHRARLEADPVEWMKFFFPKYATAEFAPFQRRFIRRAIEHSEWYEVLSWARELAKDTITMFVMMYLNLTGKKKFTLFVSSSYDAAVDLLLPYMLNFEANARIEAYYGEQKTWGAWEKGDFTAKCGARYVALGSGQSPRGKKNEQLRPDSIILSDLDTDEDTRNKDIIDKRWDWINGALIPTRSISKSLLVIFLGNIIAKDCCVVRAGAMADNWDIVNVRDTSGKSTWIEKNSEEHIDRILSKISTRAAQAEYFNNPLTEGDIFKCETWGKCPSLSKLKFAIVYADPATSNRERPKKGSSYKAAFLMGYHNGKFYIYKGFLEQTGTDQFVRWFYDLRDWVSGRVPVYNYIENNSLQDPFFSQVFQPKFLELGKTMGYINLTPDTRKKPDKAVRIEGTLEPLYRMGLLVFNEQEKGNPHMQRLVEQFKMFDMKGKAPADGPDCIEGGVWILNQKLQTISPGDFKVFSKNSNNSKRI